MSSLTEYQITRVLFFALVLHALVPTGFMPGDLLQGESLIVVCPDGLNLEDGEHDHKHGSSGENGDDAPPLADSCDYAQFLGVALLGKTHIDIAPAGLVTILSAVSMANRSNRAIHFFDIRGPPSYS